MQSKIYRLVVSSTLAFTLIRASMLAAQVPTAPFAEPSEVELGRGPIHEAFAEVVTFNPTPGVVAPRAPADPIQELPPNVRPDGTRVQWIPGYWTWDDERNDFIWVSGGWRNAPPNRRWIPGYWYEVSGGYQWISGFWAQQTNEEIQYLPQPPASVEAGATGAPPSNDHFWIPGCWVWRNATYVWRPGFWSQAAPGWIWIPAHYRYTPRGIVYIEGYWDHDLTRRGHLYAPVYYTRPVYAQTGYYYRPTSLVELGLLTASLFVQPDHQHYYYGDYYDIRHRERGFYPWYGYSAAQRGFDPLFSYYAWQHRNRNDNDWRTRIEHEYETRRNQPGLRPPQVIKRGDPNRQSAAKPIVRTNEDVLRERGAKNVETRPPEATGEWIEQMRQLRRDRREAEQPTPQSQRPPTVIAPKDQRQQPPAQEKPKRVPDANPPTDFRPRADTTRWRIPERGQQVNPAKAGSGQLQLPARPEPPKQRLTPSPKSESRTPGSRKKPKSD